MANAIPTDSRKNLMTPDNIKACLESIGWNAAQLANQAGCSPSTVHQWIAGAASMPVALAAWLQARADHAQANPIPKLDYKRGRKPWVDGVGNVKRVIEAYRLGDPKAIKATLYEIAEDGTKRTMFALRKPTLADVQRCMDGYKAEIAWIAPPTGK